MTNLREALLFAHTENHINAEEIVLLYDVNQSKNPDFPYWS